MEKIIIESQSAGVRIDKFLAKEFFLYSRGEIIKKIKGGQVLVNKKSIKPSYILEEGDELEINNFSREAQENILKPNDNIKLEILFQNENMIVVDKQAGLQVHPSHNEKENTLVNALISSFPEIKDVHDESEGGWVRPGIMHRLDKETSGVMVVARNFETFLKLKQLFKDRKIEKTYLAIAKGVFREKEGVIEKPIARSSSYKKQVIARNNTKTIVRNAITEYKVLEEFKDFSLVEVKPKTGRMHQIRIHLDSIGHGIIGDKVYGAKTAKQWEEKAKRQLLHAHKLKFELDGEEFEFISPLPNDFKDFMDAKK